MSFTIFFIFNIVTTYMTITSYKRRSTSLYLIFCRPLSSLSFKHQRTVHQKMSSKMLIGATFLAVATILVVLPKITSAAPAQFQSSHVPYNLHSAFTAEDINQLSSKSRHNIARTIAEVEKVLASDPRLPRLTR